MRLVSLELSGIRRFERAHVDLDAPLIAIVGPNEAGKTSLLHALTFVDHQGPIPNDFIRRGSDPESVYVEAKYLIEDADRELASGIAGGAELQWLSRRKRASGQVVTGLTPDPPTRDLSARRVAFDVLREELARPATFVPLPSDIMSAITSLAEALDTKEETLPQEALAQLRAVLDQLPTWIEQRTMMGGETLLRAVEAVHEFENAPTPRRAILNALDGARPRALLFTDSDRSLATSNDLASGSTRALENLAGLASVELSEILRAVQAGDYAKRETILERANQTLQTAFTSWRQSPLSVRLVCDETVLRLHIRATTGSHTPLDEHSDGLRTFVALTAFLHQRQPRGPVVLLLDEAEAHLHYDAQSDLIEVLTAQDQAGQVVYTTHSAGCLPNDLGAVRAVVAEGDAFDVRTSFWELGPGLSTLAMALGATAFALSTTRHAVIAEGGVDVILMPTLLREANGTRDLGTR